jgi:hypothetical protein
LTGFIKFSELWLFIRISSFDLLRTMDIYISFKHSLQWPPVIWSHFQQMPKTDTTLENFIYKHTIGLKNAQRNKGKKKGRIYRMSS